MTDIPPVDAPTLDKLIEWSRGYLERKRALNVAAESDRENTFALDLWTGILSTLEELKTRRAADPIESKPGPMWIPLSDVNRMVTRCKESTSEKLDVDRRVLEGLLHDSLLWRQDRQALEKARLERDQHQRTAVKLGDINVKRAQQLKALLDSWSLVPDTDNDFQARVYDWMQVCFQRPDAMLPAQRSFRFIEEALELAQASGTSREDALRLVDYVYSRPSGDIHQEIGGVMVTLSALATSFGLSMYNAGEAELHRCQENTEKIRAKDLTKPERSPLPAFKNPIANREPAIDAYVIRFHMSEQPVRREAFADGWDACYIQRPQRARAGHLEVGASEDRREVVINAPFTPDNGSGFVHFAFTPRQAIGLGETLFRKAAECLPDFQGKDGARQHPTLVDMALARATTLRATQPLTNPEHTYIVALADEFIAMVGVVKMWETACTGRNGSQQLCVKHVTG